MTKGISTRAFARLIDVDESAVRKAKKEGRVRTLPDGTIDPEQAKKAWLANTDPARTRVRTQPEVRTKVRSQVRTEAEASAAVGLIRNVLRAEGHAGADGAIDYADARTADTILKAHERDLKMARLRKEQVPIKHVRPHIEKCFHGYKQAVLRIPDRFAAEMAAELCCDETQLRNSLGRVIRIVLGELSAPVVRG
jgi:hypothetical protein